MADRLDVRPATVGRWRERFLIHRLKRPAGERRAGPPRTLSDEQVHEVIIRTLETQPRGATH